MFTVSRRGGQCGATTFRSIAELLSSSRVARDPAAGLLSKAFRSVSRTGWIPRAGGESNRLDDQLFIGYGVAVIRKWVRITGETRTLCCLAAPTGAAGIRSTCSTPSDFSPMHHEPWFLFENDVHVRIWLGTTAFDYLATAAAARNLIHDWCLRNWYAIELIRENAEGHCSVLPRLPCERLFLGP